MTRKTSISILMLTALAALFLAGCAWEKMGSSSDDSAFDDDVNNYRAVLGSMQKEVDLYGDAESSRTTTDLNVTANYYNHMSNRLGRLADIRQNMIDHMDDGRMGNGSMMNNGQMMDYDGMMTNLENWEAECRRELEQLMQWCVESDMTRSDHLDHVATHIDHMNELLSEMDRECNDMMASMGNHWENNHDMSGDHMM